VQFIVAIDVAKALAEQLPIAVRTAESSKEVRVAVPNTSGKQSQKVPKRLWR
jgi:hypothetical protein